MSPVPTQRPSGTCRLPVAVALFSITLCSVPTTAQPSGSHEVATNIGVWVGDFIIERTTQVGADEFSVGLEQTNDMLLSARYTRRLTRSLGLEANVGYSSHGWISMARSVENGVQQSNRSLISVGTIAYSLSALAGVPMSGGRIYPFLTGGVGGVSRSVNAVNGTVNQNIIFRIAFGHRFATNLGGGVAWYVTPRLMLRAEVRDWMTTVTEQVSNQPIKLHNPWLVFGFGAVL